MDELKEDMACGDETKLDMDRKISVTDSAYCSIQTAQTPQVDPETEPQYSYLSPDDASTAEIRKERVHSWQLQPTEQPKYPALDNIEFRKATFKELWPKQLLPERIDDFCEAGFFYDSRSDFTRCYMCNVLICDWRDIHIPAQEHWRHQPLCSLTNPPLIKLQDKCPTRTVEQKLLEARMSRPNYV